MTLNSTESIEVEDFRRLGIRPNELRLSVIRSAAARSAKTLAEKQLSEPTAQTERQLTEVVMSTYRLLDPRGRSQTHERMRIGRIPPADLVGAEQTDFQSDHSQPSASVQAPFAEEWLSDAELIERLDLHAPQARVRRNDSDIWVNPFSDDEIQESQPLAVKSNRLRRHIAFPVGIAVVVIGAMLSLATFRSRTGAGTFREMGEVVASKPLQQKPKDSDFAGPSVIVTGDAHSDSDNLDAIGNTTSKQPEVTEPSSETAIVESTSSREPVSASTGNLAVEDGARLADDRTSIEKTDAPLATAVPVEPVVGSTKDLIDKAENGVRSDVVSADPLSAPATEPILLKPSNIESATVGVLRRFPIPEPAKIRAAQQRMKVRVPALSRPVLDHQFKALEAEMDGVEQHHRVGSADHWVAHLTLARLAWFDESASQVRQRLLPLCGQYQVLPLELMTETFVAACESAQLLETHEHLLRSGLSIVDQLLVAELFEPSRRVGNALAKSATLVASDGSCDEVEQLRESTSQMERMAQTVSRVIEREGGMIFVTVHSKEAGTLGRYYCLMLRRWDVGMVWLTKDADSGVASAARYELVLGDEPSVDELQMLADRWLTASTRSMGRPADSMRLHAIDLLRRAEKATAGMRKWELDRKIDEMKLLLPSFLREQPAEETVETVDRR